MAEAELRETAVGLVPHGEGWFIVNTGAMGWHTVPGGGTWCGFEPADHRSELLGIGIHVLPKGESPGMYHREPDQEGFLVLAGECLVVVEGQERRMGPWDYFHCPPGTAHITIGASDEPCALLMVGTRTQPGPTDYLVEPLAARHGASVQTPTQSSSEAYAERPPITPARSAWPR